MSNISVFNETFVNIFTFFVELNIDQIRKIASYLAIINFKLFQSQKKLCGMQKLFQEQQNRFEERKRREMQLKKQNEEHQDEIEKKLLKNSANAQHSNNSRSKYDQHNPYKLRS